MSKEETYARYRQADAGATHRTLRKLLLAALFPTELHRDSCGAGNDNFNTVTLDPDGTTPRMPLTTNMYATVTMAFRAFPPTKSYSTTLNAR